MENRKLIFIAILLSLSILNYTRIEGVELIKNLQFLSIFTIGLLSGILIYGLINLLKNRK